MRIPVGGGFAGRIAAERRAIVLDDVDHADVLNPILPQRGIKSLLGVPLIVRGEVTGVLHVGTLTPRDFRDDHVELLQLAGERIAVGLEQTRLIAGERSGRVRSERLQTVTDLALAHLELNELLVQRNPSRSPPDRRFRGAQRFRVADRGRGQRSGSAGRGPAAPFRALCQEREHSG